MEPKPEPEVFDLIDVYEMQVRPLVEQILAICEENRMPAVMAFTNRIDLDGWNTVYSAKQFKGRQVGQLVHLMHILKDAAVAMPKEAAEGIAVAIAMSQAGKGNQPEALSPGGIYDPRKAH